MAFTSPLRYPGGKGKLTDFFKAVIVENDLIGCDYAEPYAGGAGIAINLLLHGHASKIHLNDLNRSVFAFWQCVKNRSDELCRLISDRPLSMDEWFRQKQIQRDTDATELELGFSTFYLNRTNRSGIVWGGVIGGKNQQGNWKLDARFNRSELLERVERIATFANEISVTNLDADQFILKVIPKLPRKSLIYLDPPYYVKGQGLYENHYQHDDHLRVAKLVQSKIKRPWVVSYDHAAEIVSMYPCVYSQVYGINYSAQDRYKGAEVMFFSDRLRVPAVDNPVKMRAA